MSEAAIIAAAFRRYARVIREPYERARKSKEEWIARTGSGHVTLVSAADYEAERSAYAKAAEFDAIAEEHEKTAKIVEGK